MCVYIYIYIERERCVYTYVYIYIYIYIHILCLSLLSRPPFATPSFPAPLLHSFVPFATHLSPLSRPPVACSRATFLRNEDDADPLSGPPTPQDLSKPGFTFLLRGVLVVQTLWWSRPFVPSPLCQH